MSKAFVRDDGDRDDDEADAARGPAESPVAVARIYITPQGHARLKRELLHLLDVERPEVVRTVQWAASNGDRSENADYQYGKRRLRQIDRRIRFLTRRLDLAEVVDPLGQPNPEQVFFGATVDYFDGQGVEHTVRIVGVDEIDPHRGWISWVSPVARALLKAREGDEVDVRTPLGVQRLEVVGIRYESLEPADDAHAASDDGEDDRDDEREPGHAGDPAGASPGGGATAG